MRYLRLIGFFWRQTLLREMAYPKNFWFLSVVQVAGFGTMLLSVQVIFSQTSTLVGWSKDAALTFIAIYGIMIALLKLFFEASFIRFCGDVHRGTFDLQLVQPVDPRLSISFRGLLLDQLGFLFFNVGLLLWLCLHGVFSVTVASFFGFSVLFVLGLCIGYCIFFAMTLLIFWAPTIEHFSYLFAVLVSVVRFPLGIYGATARRIFLTILPLGFIVSVPAEFLLGVGTWRGIVIAAVVALFIWILTQRWWRFAVKHYASASS